MASINFPDPLTQTPPNTFSPTSTPESTSNGTTYVWDGNVWRVSGSSVFVNTTGDNMTGDLTLGTDKITLNATDGSITAAGNIISGLEPGQGLNDGVKLGKTGCISLSRTDSTGNVFNVTTTGNANRLIQMTAGGTAYFAGDTGIGGTPGTAGGAAPVPNITLKADGSINTNGNIVYVIPNEAQHYLGRNSSKSFNGLRLQVADTSDTALNPTMIECKSRPAGVDTVTVDVKADGSAEFAGEITGSAINGGSGNNTGRIGANGSVIIDRDPGSGVNFIVGRQSGVQQFAITGGGAASFAGPVTCDENLVLYRKTTTASAQLAVFKSDNGGVSTQKVTFFASGNASFAGEVTASNVTFNLEADDATKYTSTTDADGVVTSVYNGATLDMKEVGLALVALKTAAAAASDFTTLKSAIATALANI